VRLRVIDGHLDAGLQIQADRQEELQSRWLITFTLDQVNPDGRLTSFESAAD
jgi:hypothetical protein